ncbi:MAG: hypothetical protein IPO21_02210 [Bacteroidales bacterium]|nr:hypothetical protein [Bacteroidales bacterium]
MENKISVTINAETTKVILDAIKTIEDNLPFLINLSVEDRKNLPKMGDKTVAFVTKALEYSKQNKDVVPSFLDVAEFEKDVDVVTNLSRVLVPLHQLAEKIDDTTMLGGSEAYTAALVFYSAVKGAAKAGVPGMKTIYNELQARFPGRSKGSANS